MDERSGVVARAGGDVAEVDMAAGDERCVGGGGLAQLERGLCGAARGVLLADTVECVGQHAVRLGHQQPITLGVGLYQLEGALGGILALQGRAVAGKDAGGIGLQAASGTQWFVNGRIKVQLRRRFQQCGTGAALVDAAIGISQCLQ